MKVLIGCWAAIIKDKKLLLTKRVDSKKNYPNCRTFPAGTLEDSDESLASAAVREVKEEVNLDFIPKEKLGFYETNTSNYRIIGFIFLWEWSGTVQALESEVSDIGWFSFAEDRKLELAFSYIETIEDLYDRKLIK